MEHLSGLRALIDINFEKTKTFFKWMQLIYTFACVLPFILIITEEDSHSKKVIPLLIWS